MEIRVSLLLTLCAVCLLPASPFSSSSSSLLAAAADDLPGPSHHDDLQSTDACASSGRVAADCKASYHQRTVPSWHTARRTSVAFVIRQCKLVSGWRPRKHRSVLSNGPCGYGTISCVFTLCFPTFWTFLAVHLSLYSASRKLKETLDQGCKNLVFFIKVFRLSSLFRCVFVSDVKSQLKKIMIEIRNWIWFRIHDDEELQIRIWTFEAFRHLIFKKNNT